jgi:hypothetical protein
MALSYASPLLPPRSPVLLRALLLLLLLLLIATELAAAQRQLLGPDEELARRARAWEREHAPTGAELAWLGRKEIAYFVVLALSACRVLASLGSAAAALRAAAAAQAQQGGGAQRRGTGRPQGPARAVNMYTLLLGALAGVCAYMTWTEIVSFIEVDVAAHGQSLGYWFSHSKVFVRAYILVTESKSGWVWSSQLLVFVAPLMLFFRAHASNLASSSGSGSGASVPVIAYALLGFLGAISLATPLFMVEISLRYRAAAAAAAVAGSQPRSAASGAAAPPLAPAPGGGGGVAATAGVSQVSQVRHVRFALSVERQGFFPLRGCPLPLPPPPSGRCGVRHTSPATPSGRWRSPSRAAWCLPVVADGCC